MKKTVDWYAISLLEDKFSDEGLKVEMTQLPLVSVIVNCYDGGQYLQDIGFSHSLKNWEIVFWDNCSKDNSAEIAGFEGTLRYFKSTEALA